MLAAAIAPVNADPLNSKEKNRAIESIGTLLTENYVFPDVAEKMRSHIQSELKSGRYSTLKDTNAFASKLTEDLQSISKDKHLRIFHAPERIADQRKRDDEPKSDDIPPQVLQQAKRENFGFSEVKIIEGNIGYLKLNKFFDASIAGDTAVAAMNFFANAEALIIDLRRNGGGSPSMIQLLTSYLYPSEPVHLNNFYWRPTDTHTQTWTLPHVPGIRRPDMPVYVLTSNRTFSAAEEFSYNLRNLERATLIGETTGGGAHPGGSQIVDDQFMIWLPEGRAINPITNTNWEGVGVKPHIESSEQDALGIAHETALLALAKENPGEGGQLFRWYLESLEAENNPVTLEAETLAAYVGTYGPRQLSFVDGELYYQRKGRNKLKLSALSHTKFAVETLPGFRLEVVMKKGEAIALRALYDNGRVNENPRSKKI